MRWRDPATPIGVEEVEGISYGGDLVFAQRVGAHRCRWIKEIGEAEISSAVARLGVRENLWRRIGRDWTWEWVDRHGLIQLVNCFQDLPVIKWDDLTAELNSLYVHKSLELFLFI
jgi:muconolactone delta-isomerase